jgi:chromosomal replication initiation ATPase DnaA
MQKLAYDVVKSHFDDISSEKETLCLIINGVAGTGKSYLINAIRNLLQSECAVTEAHQGGNPCHVSVIF